MLLTSPKIELLNSAEYTCNSFVESYILTNAYPVSEFVIVTTEWGNAIAKTKIT